MSCAAKERCGVESHHSNRISQVSLTARNINVPRRFFVAILDRVRVIRRHDSRYAFYISIVSQYELRFVFYSCAVKGCFQHLACGVEDEFPVPGQTKYPEQRRPALPPFIAEKYGSTLQPETNPAAAPAKCGCQLYHADCCILYGQDQTIK